MNLNVDWSRPVVLRDATKQNMIYSVNLDRLPGSAGVYIFGRRWGAQFEALYVGKAGRIRSRVRTHLNNLRLMQHLRNARNGKRIVLAGTFQPKPGQRLSKALPLVERALIRHFLSEGHNLVNVQGTQLRKHELNSTGKYPKRFFPSAIFLEKSKGD
jgi:hypothetical protein